jgi:MerR family transcriptional regulator/heat shock protein HspR
VASESSTGAGSSMTRGASSFGPDDDTPVFVISVAAQLAGMHAQTLRQYDRLGLVSPSRTRGGGRRYSGRDVALLREVQRLSQEEGVSLAGIQRILELENQVTALRARVAELADELTRQAQRSDARAQLGSRIFAAGTRGEIVALRPGQRPRFGSASQALVVWQPAYGEQPRPR